MEEPDGARHPASASSVSRGFGLGRVAVPGKSTEVTAIPELLKLIEPSGAIALGSQSEVAKDPIAGGGE